MADQELRENTSDDTAAYRDGPAAKKGAKWLWLLLPLILLALLLFGLLNNKNDDDNQNASNANNSSQNQAASTDDQTADSNSGTDNAAFAALDKEYKDQFTADARAVYFNPDTAQIQDETASNAKLEAIAAFAKENADAKLQANGSIFDTDQSDSSSGLAKQRAELIKKLLVEKGVKAENVSVSTINNYEGKDDTARAAYARSVTVSVVE